MTWTIAFILIAIYILANIVVYYMQERLLFKPEKLPADFQYKYLVLNELIALLKHGNLRSNITHCHAPLLVANHH